MVEKRLDSPIVPARYLVLGWLCAAAVIAYMQRFVLGAAESEIRSDIAITREDMGAALSSFFWGYALFQIPSGWLADRWGTRRLLSLLALTWSIATAATPVADGFMSLFTLRFIAGCAQAGIFCCATRTIALWFPATERGMTSGFLGSSMSIGGAVSALLTGILLPLLDWRSLFVLFAIPGFIWSLCFYLWFRDTPDEMGVTSANTADPALRDLTPPLETSSPKLETPWLRLLQSPLMYFIGGQQFFRAAGYVFYASWFATFLQETRELPADQAARLTSMPLWAVVIGSPLGGILSDWFFARTGSKRVARSGIAAASMFACALLIALAYLVNNVLGAILLISVGSFCSSLGGPCAYATTIDVGGNHVGTVFSVMNMCGNVGAAVFPMIVPLLVAAAGTWDIVFLFFAGIYVAAGLCWLLVNPNVIIFANRSDDDQS